MSPKRGARRVVLMNADRRRPIVAAFVVAVLPLAVPVPAQFGDIGLSGVDGRRFATHGRWC